MCLISDGDAQKDIFGLRLKNNGEILGGLAQQGQKGDKVIFAFRTIANKIGEYRLQMNYCSQEGLGREQCHNSGKK